MHNSSIRFGESIRSLQKGEEVEFEVARSEEGRDKAINVTKPKGASVKGPSGYAKGMYGRVNVNKTGSGDADNGGYRGLYGQYSVLMRN